MNDVYDELVEMLPFPVMVALRQFDVLARGDVPLACQLVHYCATYSRDLARAGKQFSVHFCVRPLVGTRE